MGENAAQTTLDAIVSGAPQNKMIYAVSAASQIIPWRRENF